MIRLYAYSLMILLSACVISSRGEVVVESLQDNGSITWSAPINPSARFDIEWAYEAGGPWHKTFQNQQTVDAFNHTQFVARVPMFYRVVQTTQSVPMGMAYIEGGDTRLGQDSFADAGYTNYISPFWIDRTEVPIELWREVYQWATNNGYQFDNPGLAKTSRHPVTTINWFDAVKWCNARSEREGLDVVYQAGFFSIYKTGVLENITFIPERNGYRLPSAAEWEKAARGGREGFRFPWASQIVTHQLANYVAFTNGYSYDQAASNSFHPIANDGVFPYTLPVGFFPPNEFGIYDMAGNVEEWVWNRLSGMSTLHRTNWFGPTSTSEIFRVIRGGSWRFEANFLRTHQEFQAYPTNNFIGTQNLGFRTVRSAW